MDIKWLSKLVGVWMMMMMMMILHEGSCESDTPVESCPCIEKDNCPRVFGISDLDEQELGHMEPCPDPEKVRCCGVTVRVVKSVDKEPDEDVVLFLDQDEKEKGQDSTDELQPNPSEKDVQIETTEKIEIDYEDDEPTTRAFPDYELLDHTDAYEDQTTLPSEDQEYISDSLDPNAATDRSDSVSEKDLEFSESNNHYKLHAPPRNFLRTTKPREEYAVNSTKDGDVQSEPATTTEIPALQNDRPIRKYSGMRRKLPGQRNQNPTNGYETSSEAPPATSPESVETSTESYAAKRPSPILRQSYKRPYTTSPGYSAEIIEPPATVPTQRMSPFRRRRPYGSTTTTTTTTTPNTEPVIPIVQVIQPDKVVLEVQEGSLDNNHNYQTTYEDTAMHKNAEEINQYTPSPPKIKPDIPPIGEVKPYIPMPDEVNPYLKYPENIQPHIQHSVAIKQYIPPFDEVKPYIHPSAEVNQHIQPSDEVKPTSQLSNSPLRKTFLGRRPMILRQHGSSTTTEAPPTKASPADGHANHEETDKVKVPDLTEVTTEPSKTLASLLNYGNRQRTRPVFRGRPSTPQTSTPETSISNPPDAHSSEAKSETLEQHVQEVITQKLTSADQRSNNIRARTRLPGIRNDIRPNYQTLNEDKKQHKEKDEISQHKQNAQTDGQLQHIGYTPSQELIVGNQKPTSISNSPTHPNQHSDIEQSITQTGASVGEHWQTVDHTILRNQQKMISRYQTRPETSQASNQMASPPTETTIINEQMAPIRQPSSSLPPQFEPGNRNKLMFMKNQPQGTLHSKGNTIQDATNTGQSKETLGSVQEMVENKPEPIGHDGYVQNQQRQRYPGPAQSLQHKLPTNPNYEESYEETYFQQEGPNIDTWSNRGSSHQKLLQRGSQGQQRLALNPANVRYETPAQETKSITFQIESPSDAGSYEIYDTEDPDVSSYEQITSFSSPIPTKAPERLKIHSPGNVQVTSTYSKIRLNNHETGNRNSSLVSSQQNIKSSGTRFTVPSTFFESTRITPRKPLDIVPHRNTNKVEPHYYNPNDETVEKNYDLILNSETRNQLRGQYDPSKKQNERQNSVYNSDMESGYYKDTQNKNTFQRDEMIDVESVENGNTNYLVQEYVPSRQQQDNEREEEHENPHLSSFVDFSGMEASKGQDRPYWPIPPENSWELLSPNGAESQIRQKFVRQPDQYKPTSTDTSSSQRVTLKGSTTNASPASSYQEASHDSAKLHDTFKDAQSSSNFGDELVEGSRGHVRVKSTLQTRPAVDFRPSLPTPRPTYTERNTLFQSATGLTPAPTTPKPTRFRMRTTTTTEKPTFIFYGDNESDNVEQEPISSFAFPPYKKSEAAYVTPTETPPPVVEFTQIDPLPVPNRPNDNSKVEMVTIINPELPNAVYNEPYYQRNKNEEQNKGDSGRVKVKYIESVPVELDTDGKRAPSSRFPIDGFANMQNIQPVQHKRPVYGQYSSDKTPEQTVEATHISINHVDEQGEQEPHIFRHTTQRLPVEEIKLPPIDDQRYQIDISHKGNPHATSLNIPPQAEVPSKPFYSNLHQQEHQSLGLDETNAMKDPTQAVLQNPQTHQTSSFSNGYPSSSGNDWIGIDLPVHPLTPSVETPFMLSHQKIQKESKKTQENTRFHIPLQFDFEDDPDNTFHNSQTSNSFKAPFLQSSQRDEQTHPKLADEPAYFQISNNFKASSLQSSQLDEQTHPKSTTQPAHVRFTEDHFPQIPMRNAENVRRPEPEIKNIRQPTTVSIDQFQYLNNPEKDEKLYVQQQIYYPESPQTHHQFNFQQPQNTQQQQMRPTQQNFQHLNNRIPNFSTLSQHDLEQVNEPHIPVAPSVVRFGTTIDSFEVDEHISNPTNSKGPSNWHNQQPIIHINANKGLESGNLRQSVQKFEHVGQVLRHQQPSKSPEIFEYKFQTSIQHDSKGDSGLVQQRPLPLPDVTYIENRPRPLQKPWSDSTQVFSPRPPFPKPVQQHDQGINEPVTPTFVLIENGKLVQDNEGSHNPTINQGPPEHVKPNEYTNTNKRVPSPQPNIDANNLQLGQLKPGQNIRQFKPPRFMNSDEESDTLQIEGANPPNQVVAIQTRLPRPNPVIDSQKQVPTGNFDSYPTPNLPQPQRYPGNFQAFPTLPKQQQPYQLNHLAGRPPPVQSGTQSPQIVNNMLRPYKPTQPHPQNSIKFNPENQRFGFRPNPTQPRGRRSRGLTLEADDVPNVESESMEPPNSSWMGNLFDGVSFLSSKSVSDVESDDVENDPISRSGHFIEDSNDFTQEFQQVFEFKAPEFAQRGFHPMVPYSEKDPGPIIIRVHLKEHSPTEPSTHLNEI